MGALEEVCDWLCSEGRRRWAMRSRAGEKSPGPLRDQMRMGRVRGREGEVVSGEHKYLHMAHFIPQPS